MSKTPDPRYGLDCDCSALLKRQLAGTVALSKTFGSTGSLSTAFGSNSSISSLAPAEECSPEQESLGVCTRKDS
jgi:hypothetical protein